MQKTKANLVGKIIIPAACHVWPHEMRVAEILANAGHIVEFLPTSSTKTADIKLDGIEFEIKSPESSNTNTLEHMIKKALHQSSNIIIDVSRFKSMSDQQMQRFLIAEIHAVKQIKRMLLITKRSKIVDIFSLI